MLLSAPRRGSSPCHGISKAEGFSCSTSVEEPFLFIRLDGNRLTAIAGFVDCVPEFRLIDFPFYAERCAITSMRCANSLCFRILLSDHITDVGFAHATPHSSHLHGNLIQVPHLFPGNGFLFPFRLQMLTQVSCICQQYEDKNFCMTGLPK